MPWPDIKLTTSDRFVSTKLALVQFGFCTGHNSSGVLIVGSTFRINIPLKKKKKKKPKVGVG
jgi:hypothetical protein